MLKARLESWLNAVWYGDRSPGILLRSLEPLYGRLAARRQRRRVTTPATDLAGRPIVVVGNITAGGTGKTPLVIRLCHLLEAEGISPGVVSRGYGRREHDLILVDEDDPVSATGDEPRLVADRTGVPVAVGPDRKALARRLFEEGVEVVISDDGLQRSDFPRRFEICVMDGHRGLGNGRLLPAGPLREPASRLRTVDAVVVNGPVHSRTIPENAVRMTLRAEDPVRVGDKHSISFETWKAEAAGKPLVAVAGIGNPNRFFSLLESLGLVFERREFPDHHAYTAADFAGTEAARIIMTEKDAVNCRTLRLHDAWYLPVAARLPGDWERAFVDRMVHMISEQGSA